MNGEGKRDYNPILVLIIVILAALLIYLRYFSAGATFLRRVLDPPGVVKEIQRFNELVTVKYTIQKVVGLTEQKTPVGSESILLIVQAQVLGGIDLAEITAHDVRISKKHATIRMPAPRILNAFIDEKETKVWDRTKTWWTPWVPYSKDLEHKARLAAIDSIEKTAVGMGILKEAQRNAETTIRQFLRALGIESVTFETPPKVSRRIRHKAYV